ncbi:MAG: glycoside hydrolase family 71/99-like protein [Planctomycetaceae bacterium]|nr:glycoside hydrolase family 71/99-like protein [Planctomycetaceae bacterium]
MRIKRSKIVCIALMAVSMHASAATWDNDGGDRLWSNPLNWSNNTLPSLTDSIAVSISSGPILNAPTAATGKDIRIGRSGGTTFTMNGGTLNVGQWLMIGIDQSSKPGTFVMNNGTVNLGSSSPGDGHLWIGYKCVGTFTMSNGTINAPGRFGLGYSTGGAATVHLDGGVINAGDFSMTSSCTLDMTGGVLIIDDDETTLVNGYIQSGWMTAYGGEGTFSVDYDNVNPGKTTVTASLNPEKASNPLPANSAVLVSPDTLLTWTAGVGAVAHDVYLGTSNTPQFAGTQESTTFAPPTLALNTIYYWRIDEFDGTQTTVGDVWSFTTSSGLAQTPNPANGTMNVPLDKILGWTAGYGAVSHDVFLGTDIRDVRNAQRLAGDLDGNNAVEVNDLMILAECWLGDPSLTEPYAGVLPGRTMVDMLDAAMLAGNWMAQSAPFFEGNTYGLTHAPGSLQSNTTYYWRVDEVCGPERRQGDVWTFTTTAGDSEGTLIGKIMCGYQGWFNTPTDGASRGWVHWGRGGFSLTNCTVDMWPDMTEMGTDEKYLAPDFFDGTDHYVFSSYNRNTVLRHFQWMQQYGIDGVYLQRFATELTPGSAELNHRNAVLSHVKEGANLYGRKYVVMYDLSGLGLGGTATVINDWKDLVDNLDVTRDPADTAYAYHKGKPVVAVWGIGFSDRDYSNEECRDLVAFLKNDPVYGANTVMIGVNDNWQSNSDPYVQQTLQLADIISPWLVGRFSDTAGINSWANQKGIPNKNWCASNGKDFLPVLFPGFSWHNLNGGPLNQIPRNGGQFLWDQVKANIAIVGANMLYVAMFDEVDEGTAIFKVTNTPPVPGGVTMFVTYEGLPSDDYMWLTGQAGSTLRGEIPLTQTRPSR